MPSTSSFAAEPVSEERILSFATFELFIAKRMLLESGNPVRIGSRALEILIALVSRAGEVVSKQDLIRCAWPGVPDSDSNLKVHIAMLRKCLGITPGGASYIICVSGQGYSFVAPVKRLTGIGTLCGIKSTGTSPGSLTRLVGRDEVIEFLAAQLPRRSLVTLVGPGGVGKSSVGIAVATRLGPDYPQGVAYVDLAEIEDTNRIPARLCTALGRVSTGDMPVTTLLTSLRGTRRLIFLDNCEHVVERAAEFVEGLLTLAPGPNILATSREPLRCPGEWSYRLPALKTPTECSGLTAAVALSFPAVELFVARAISSLESFELTDRNAPAVGEICCRADGLPLAIELTAAKLNILSVSEICAALEAEPLLLTQDGGSNQARQRSLRATLEWSYAALPPSEQAIFRWLSVFRGPFSAESAIAVAGAVSVRDRDVLECLMSLAEKSLVTTHITGPVVHYRLSHIARAYAYEKLTVSEEHGLVLDAFEQLRSLSSKTECQPDL